MIKGKNKKQYVNVLLADCARGMKNHDTVKA